MRTKSKQFIGVGIGILMGISNFLWADSIDSCSLEKTKNAVEGYMCKNETPEGDVVWILVMKTTNGKKVWKDMKSGFLVSNILDRKYTQGEAARTCTDPSSEQEAKGNLTTINWSLPSGYPKSFNGKHGFPNKDSDFMTLGANGVLKVIDMRRKWFWSSSIYPDYGDIYGIGVDGDDGYLYAIIHASGESVLCVGR